MPRPLSLDDNRLFSANTKERDVAAGLYALVKDLPIISPHGHTDPAWFATNDPFTNATELLLSPDHYVFRMLYSQGIDMDAVGVGSRKGPSEADPKAAWRVFAKNFYLMRGTPSWMWLNHVFWYVMGFEVVLDESTADFYYDRIGELLATESYRPRALLERFNIEAIATTEGPVDPLLHHKAIKASGWGGKVVTAYRPDSVVDPEHENFAADLKTFGDMTGEDVMTFKGYLAAHRKRRAEFIEMGATSSDHGHISARTANLSFTDAEALFSKALKGDMTPLEADVFRGQMLTEMARMSLDDGLVLQIHPGVHRNHNKGVFDKYGRDKGADIPISGEFVSNIKPLLDAFGNDPRLSVILFTLDETTYARELAPLAGHYPALKLGPAWWFNDSPEGMLRFRETVTPIAGFYNTVGFNDDTRAFFSIPARHDMARRIDARYLSSLVCEHRLDHYEAESLIVDLAYNLPKAAYKF